MDSEAVLNHILVMSAAGVGIYGAWITAGWALKSLALLTRTPSERAYDASRDWDDPSSRPGRW